MANSDFDCILLNYMEQWSVCLFFYTKGFLRVSKSKLQNVSKGRGFERIRFKDEVVKTNEEKIFGILVTFS